MTKAQCPNDCDQCEIKEDCIRVFEAKADTCSFRPPTGLRRKVSNNEGNPCVTGVYTGIKFLPLDITAVCGCSVVGDGKWRRK